MKSNVHCNEGCLVNDENAKILRMMGSTYVDVPLPSVISSPYTWPSRNVGVYELSAASSFAYMPLVAPVLS